jgi:hypothetical protein
MVSSSQGDEKRRFAIASGHEHAFGLPLARLLPLERTEVLAGQFTRPAYDGPRHPRISTIAANEDVSSV